MGESDDYKPTEVCLDQLDHCNYFLDTLANKYGSKLKLLNMQHFQEVHPRFTKVMEVASAYSMHKEANAKKGSSVVLDLSLWGGQQDLMYVPDNVVVSLWGRGKGVCEEKGKAVLSSVSIGCNQINGTSFSLAVLQQAFASRKHLPGICQAGHYHFAEGSDHKPVFGKVLEAYFEEAVDLLFFQIRRVADKHV